MNVNYGFVSVTIYKKNAKKKKKRFEKVSRSSHCFVFMKLQKVKMSSK